MGWGVGSSFGVHCGGKGSLRREEMQASSLNTSLKGLAQTKVYNVMRGVRRWRKRS